MPLPTLLDLKKIEAGIGYDIVNEALPIAPELSVIPATTINGSSMELTVLTGNPTVSFRNVNEGTDRSKATHDTRIFQAHIIDQQIAIDIRLLQGLKGDAAARYKASHATATLQEALRVVSKQTYYGISNDAKGFPGLLAQYGGADAEVDATGSTAKTSAWLLYCGAMGTEFIFGNGQTITFGDNWKEETVYDANGKPYQAETNWLNGRIGLRLANKNHAVRIKNIGTDTGKGLSDTLLYAAIEKFTERSGGIMPTHIFANGRSIEQLRKGRTATNQKGDPAPLPTMWEGIPLIRTGGLLNNES